MEDPVERAQFVAGDAGGEVYTAPTAFETPFNTYLKDANPTGAVNNGRAKVAWNVRPEVDVKGGAYQLVEEDVPNPGRIAPHRVAVRFNKPVSSAEVTMTYRDH